MLFAGCESSTLGPPGYEPPGMVGGDPNHQDGLVAFASRLIKVGPNHGSLMGSTCFKGLPELFRYGHVASALRQNLQLQQIQQLYTFKFFVGLIWNGPRGLLSYRYDAR